MEFHLQEFTNPPIDSPVEKKIPFFQPALSCLQLALRFLADFLIAILIGALFFLPLYPFIHNSEYELLFAALFTQLGLLIVFIYRLNRLRKIGQPLFGLWEGPVRPALRWGVAIGLLLFALNVLHGMALEFWTDFDLTENNPWMEIQDFSPIARYGTLLVGGIVAPVVEEFLLRGLMFGAFAALGYPLTGAFFTTILFIFLHLDPVNSLAYAMLGFGFIWVYWRTRNLASAILAHAINNLVGFFLILLP